MIDVPGHVSSSKNNEFLQAWSSAVFRSAPDVWAIDQLFPIMPLHRLEEEPRQAATLSDITCDSDGKFDQFISSGTTTFQIGGGQANQSLRSFSGQ